MFLLDRKVYFFPPLCHYVFFTLLFLSDIFEKSSNLHLKEEIGLASFRTFFLLQFGWYVHWTFSITCKVCETFLMNNIVFPRLKILPISFEILEGPKRYIIPLSAGVDSLLPSLPRNCNHILDYPCTWTFLLVQVKSIVLDRKVGVQFVNHKYDYRPTLDDTKSTYQLPSCEVVIIMIKFFEKHKK